MILKWYYGMYKENQLVINTKKNEVIFACLLYSLVFTNDIITFHPSESQNHDINDLILQWMNN